MTTLSNTNVDTISVLQSMAASVHRNQSRRDGTPYFFHLFRVAELTKKYDCLETYVVALLHDAIEDEQATVDYLRWHLRYAIKDEEMVDSILVRIQKMDKRQYESYDAYIIALGADTICRRVKMCDICDNVTDRPTKKALAKYVHNLTYLLGLEMEHNSDRV